MRKVSLKRQFKMIVIAIVIMMGMILTSTLGQKSINQINKQPIQIKVTSPQLNQLRSIKKPPNLYLAVVSR